MRIALALAGLTAASLLLRTGALDAGYWIDEAISVGIATHPAGAIPGVLRLDGSPPLYYLLLHAWIEVAGTGEAATRLLSLGFALLAVPVAWWAGTAAGGRRAGALAAACAAGCPFLTAYAQETRMYSLVAVLSLLAGGSFVLAFLRGRRRHVALLGLWLALLLYTHSWAVFLVAAMAAAWLALWRDGRVAGRDGLLLAAGLAVAYAPWVPSLLFQAAHTGSPWASRPPLYWALAVPGGLFGYVAAPLLCAAVALAWRHRPAGDAARVLAIVALAGVALAWLWSQVEPSWSPRYAAVLFGPFVLAGAAVLARGGTPATAAALVVVAAIWAVGGAPEAKSNARRIAAVVEPSLRPGDLVVSTQPEQVPVLHRYLPRGVRYLTPLGPVGDPRLTDWRDGLARLRRGQAWRRLDPVLDRLPAGRRVVLVTPVRRRYVSQAPWSRTVRVRTREWRAAVRAHPRLRPVARVGGVRLRRFRSAVRAEVFVSVRP